MRQKWFFRSVLSILIVCLITLGAVRFNNRYPVLQSGDAPTADQLSCGVALVGWEQTPAGDWQFRLSELPAGQSLAVCIVQRSKDAPPDAMEPLGGLDEFFLINEPTQILTLSSTSAPTAWLLTTETAWRWINLRTNLQLVALVSFVSMGACILALFRFKPQRELLYFLLYIIVMFFWGLTVILSPSDTTPLRQFLSRIYFPFAVLVPFWLCIALTHLSFFRSKVKNALFLAGTSILLLIPTLGTERSVRNPFLALEMLCLVVLLTYTYSTGKRSSRYLLAGYLPTIGLRMLILLLPLGVGCEAESFAFYMIRCARIYDIPFALGCLVYVCRRFALQFDRAEQLTLELEDRVARRTQALQNETNARKSMMLNIFHDLRSPLFVVSNGLETLEAAPESLPALLPILQQRVDFIRNLTEDLFLAAKLEQKQILLNEDRILFNEVSAAVCEGCQSEAQKKKIRLSVELSTALPVWGDAMRLEQIVQNLLTNAIHYTPAGGTVRVEGSISGENVLLRVIDTGCGIAPEDQPAVFDRYFHTTTNTKHDSTGLGLTIAQELAHLHHGEITLQSEVGKGSCFTLRLPLLQTD